MRLFVCGDQDQDFIEETLDYINTNHSITEICGSAASRCMDVVIPWAKRKNIPITLYFPEEISVPGMIAQNTEIIRKEQPFAVLIYSENPDVIDCIIADSEQSDSVHYVIKENV